MKRNAIIRIIAYSLTVLILASVMGAVIGTNGSIFSGFFINIPNSDEDKYIQAQSAVEIKDSLTKVEIVWLSGIVNISYGDSLKFSEDKKDDAEPLMYTFDGEKLKINSHKRVQKMGLPSLTKSFETKNLNITLPKSIRELEVEVVSADVNISDITISECEIENVSGDVNIVNCLFDEFDSEAVSGSLSFEGDISEKASISTVSGKMELSLPKNKGFTADVTSISGKLSTEFECSARNNKYISGDGYTKIDFETVSGDMRINISKSVMTEVTATDKIQEAESESI